VPPGGLRGQTRFGRKRGEPGAAKVAKHGVWLLHLALTHGQHHFNVPASDEDVLPAIVVEVADGGRVACHRQAEHTHSAAAGDVGEISLSRVSEDGEGLVVKRHEHDIGIAVVVDIAEIHAHSGDPLGILAQCDVALEGDLFKFPAALVME